MQQQVALQSAKRRCIDQGASLSPRFTNSFNSRENADTGLTTIDTHRDQQALRVKRTPRPEDQQNLPAEPEAQQADSPSAHEGHLNLLADLATSPETLRPQLINLPLQMTTRAADEISTVTSPPVDVLPAAWNYQFESLQLQNGASQNSLLEQTGLNAHSQDGIIMVAAERQDDEYCSGGQSQRYINGNMALRN